MRYILFYIFQISLWSCSEGTKVKELVVKESIEEPQVQSRTVEETRNYRELVIYENRLDSFAIPFAEKSMLIPLRNYYEPYLVGMNIGQQDGPDFTYIDILKGDDNPIAYLKFDPENKLRLDQIMILSPTAIDQYGVRVGDSYQQVIDKRGVGFKNYTNYHQHTYLHIEGSNIYYEINGDISMPAEMLDNLDELKLSEEQLQKCYVEHIIWRKRN